MEETEQRDTRETDGKRLRGTDKEEETERRDGGEETEGKRLRCRGREERRRRTVQLFKIEKKISEHSLHKRRISEIFF